MWTPGRGRLPGGLPSCSDRIRSNECSPARQINARGTTSVEVQTSPISGGLTRRATAWGARELAARHTSTVVLKWYNSCMSAASEGAEMPAQAALSSHAASTRLGIHDVVRQLCSHLGPSLVATLANVNDPKLPHKRARPDGPEPRYELYQRLLAAHRAWTMLSWADNDHVARAWFIGANPRLDERAPVIALRDGLVAEVLAACSDFVEPQAQA